MPSLLLLLLAIGCASCEALAKGGSALKNAVVHGRKAVREGVGSDPTILIDVELKFKTKETYFFSHEAEGTPEAVVKARQKSLSTKQYGMADRMRSMTLSDTYYGAAAAGYDFAKTSEKTVHIFEAYKNQQQLDLHMSHPAFKEFQGYRGFGGKVADGSNFATYPVAHKWVKNKEGEWTYTPGYGQSAGDEDPDMLSRLQAWVGSGFQVDEGSVV